MKRHLFLSAIVLMVMCLCASAQNAIEGTLLLRDGNKVSGLVETNPDGSAKVVTDTGDTFYFTASEIDRFREKGELQEVVPGMKYKEYKNYYSTWHYIQQTNDKYRPGLALALSALFPGIGEAYVGEWGRAAAFTLLDGACLTVFTLGLTNVSNEKYNIEVPDYFYYIDEYGYNSIDPKYMAEYEKILTEYHNKNMWTFIAGAIGMGLCRLWSASDVNKVAKIKNLYYRDIRGLSSVQFDLEPCVGQIGALAMQPTSVAGLTLRITF